MKPIAQCVNLACMWEATAPKPGNVYRGADFEDVTYADFLTSAVVIGSPLEGAIQRGVGAAMLEAVAATQVAVNSNTNLGTILLLAPLAAVPQHRSLRDGIGDVLADLTTEDTRLAYEAIRLANPGGLSEVAEADVRAEPPHITLQEAMQLAAERDLIARQYTNGFKQVFWVAEQILVRELPLGEAIVYSFLELLSQFPDSLIARKCGEEVSTRVSQQAAAVIAQGFPGSTAYERALADFDFWLRSDGHRRNPGTSADLIAAGLFVLLREEQLNWPVKFY